MKNQKLQLSFILAISFFAFSAFNIYDQVGEKKINLDIVYIGNSITQGVQLPNPKEDAPPATATEYLRHKSGITSAEFSNQGRSGYKIVFQQPIWYSPTTYNHSRYLAGGLARLQTYFPELQELVKEYTKSNPGHVFMGDVKAFEYFKNNHLTELIPESGNAGTFYLHPNKKGAAELGKFWGEGIYQCMSK